MSLKIVTLLASRRHSKWDEMRLSSDINDFRRTLMHRLTKNIGTSNPDAGIGISDLSTVKKILVCRPNHRLGNLLLVTPLLDELAATFPESSVDLFVKGTAAHDIFRNYEKVNKIIALPRKPFKRPLSYVLGWLRLKATRYDIVINVDKGSSSGRLSTKWANARWRFFGDEGDILLNPTRHIAKVPVQNLRLGLEKIGIEKRRNPVPQLSLKLTRREIADGRKKLKSLVNNNRKTIAVFTYATGRKAYTAEWWKTFYGKLRTHYKQYNIIEILPVENISNIAFSAKTFYSKDIREIAALIANTKVFIGADSGIMHLASASGTPTIGLFSVTDESKYEPYNSKSVAINTTKTKIEKCFVALNKILTRHSS